METVILENLAKGFSTEIAKETKSLVSDVTDELYQLINGNVNKYFKSQIKLYKTLKNILYGSSPVDIYKFYFPIKIKPPITLQWHTDTSSVSNVFCRTNFVTLIGDAGCGKTTLTKFLFLNCLETKYAIPILIELRNLNDSELSFITYLKDNILFSKLFENENIYERFLEKGKFVFFIDGYDELNYEIKGKATKDIIKFVEKYPNNKYLITSRPHSNAEGISIFNNYKVLPLCDDEVKAFIDLQLSNEIEIAERIKNSIKQAKERNIEEFLSNPLLLSLYILTFQRNADIPNSKHIFYRRVVQTLFLEHDSVSKSGFIRPTKTQLAQEQFEDILKKVSFVSYFNGKFNFSLDYLIPLLNKIKQKSPDLKFDNNKLIEDLKSLSLWVEDSGVLSFNHRSIQEYYSALYIMELDGESKTVIYSKIRNSIIENQVGEIEHLLSLCKELDEIDYLKFFYIPVVSKFLSCIKSDTNENIVITLFPYLCKTIYKNPNQFNIQSHPYLRLPNLAFSDEYQKLIELLKEEIGVIQRRKILSDFWETNSIKIGNKFQRVSSKTEIHFNEEFPADLVEYIVSRDDLMSELIAFAKKLRLSYETLAEYIQQRKATNQEILDMI